MKIPKSLNEAINLIHESLTDEQIDFIANNPPHSIHHTFGRLIRNDWGLWESGPLVQEVKTRFKLFGHGDDVSSLILNGVWAMTLNDNVEEALNRTAEKIRQHWIACGLDPETGEDKGPLPRKIFFVIETPSKK
jgi:hypothetical protein